LRTVLAVLPAPLNPASGQAPESDTSPVIQL
jgi:hypothetical protein